jgi:ribosome biogenesis protein BRX1
MQNLRDMLPHSKSESKVESKKDIANQLDEICIMKNANKCIFLENKKRKDTYCWISSIGRGPSIKFLIENVHTMEELKMTGNCLKASRALLSFDPRFESTPHYILMKELLTHVFSTPNHHPRSQPFFDHVLTFTILDHRIWFRNYQIVEESGALAEIGPRFALNPIKIFEGSFTGATLWTNENYVSPNDRRRALKLQMKGKYKDKVMNREARIARQPKGAAYADLDPNEEIFETVAPEEASIPFKKVFKRRKSSTS